MITRLVVLDDHDSEHFYTVGCYGVNKIEEHSAQGEGDKWYYDVYFEGGKTERHFMFKSVFFEDKIVTPSDS